jgi:site-specific recombinase XerD
MKADRQFVTVIVYLPHPKKGPFLATETALIPAPPVGPLIAWQEKIDATKAFIRASRAASTRHAYAQDWKRFLRGCEERGEAIDVDRGPVSGAIVPRHLASMAARGQTVPSIGRRAAALSYVHKLRNLKSPTSTPEVRAWMSGIRRTLGVRPCHRKAAADAEVIHSLLAAIPKDTMCGLRDRALLSLGFDAAMRRSELVALDVEDFEPTPQGMRVIVRRSKTDQVGAGQEIAIPTGRYIRPWAAVQAWLESAGISEGAVFRSIRRGGHIRDARLSSHAVATIVKRWAKAAGLEVREYSGHSLRSGFATEAVETGADLPAICAVTRHKSLTTLLGYVRRRNAFKAHPGRDFCDS